MKWYFYLTELSKIFLQTKFHMNLSSVTTKINLALLIDSRRYSMKKLIHFNVTFIVMRIPNYSIKLNISKMNWSIKSIKEKYYSLFSKRMMNYLTTTRTCWSILMSFLNNTKILCILPLLHQNIYITKYKDKSVFFNNFFAKQYFLINNSSALPSVSLEQTENLFSSINFI